MAAKFLFVCTGNRDRSPTAEYVYRDSPDFEARSAGTSRYANTPISDDLARWADAIIVMEPGHEASIRSRFPDAVAGKPIFCLKIPDEYQRMDPRLRKLIQLKMAPILKQLYV